MTDEAGMHEGRVGEEASPGKKNGRSEEEEKAPMAKT